MNVSPPRVFGAVLALGLLLVVGASFASAEPAPSAGAVQAQTPPQNDGKKPALRHGSQSKASDGTLVVWDAVNGVFLVPKHPDAYWIDNRFYRYDHGVWTTAPAIAGPWDLIAEHLVPTVALGHYTPVKTSVTAVLPSGREAIFEPRLKVYKVAGRKGVFLFDGAFYRYDDGVWLESKTDDGPWNVGPAKALPPPLRKAVPEPSDGQEVVLPSGETVVYGADARLFALKDKPSVVLFDGSFYEKREEKWFASNGSAKAFGEVALSQVPQPVRAKFPKAGVGAKPKHDKDEKAPNAKRDKAGKNAGGKARGKNVGKNAGKKTTNTDSQDSE